MKVKQVVIVEGKTDTMKLKKIFGQENIDTIETKGLALNIDTLKFILDVNKSRGVIIFTDPDGPGVKIRDKINSYLDFKCFNAFINKKSLKTSKKIGIAEADENEIKRALKGVIKFKGDQINTISWEEYLNNEFYLKQSRVKIASFYNWNENINSKKLFVWLNVLKLSVKDVRNILKEK